jgi:aryl-alcohol dehydrogenase-like predicted oxidoreductase
MLYTEFGAGGLKSSVLGFGCAPLLGRAGKRESLRALSAAYECGITFYDTARSYGYGECEALLGEFLRGKRDRVLVSTKFGIVPAKQNLLKQIAKPLIRGALHAVPSARKLVQKGIRGEFQEGQFTVAVLQQSIAESLRKLQTDYVDILFLHAAPAHVLEQGDVLREMEKLIQAGRVRMAGLSADPDVIETALERRPRPLSAMQFPCNVFDLSMTQRIASASSSGFGFAANHPFGGVRRVAETRQSLREIANSHETPAELREKLGSVDDRVLAEVVLNVITQGTGIQVVIPAMVRPDHLRANARAVLNSRFSAGEIQWLRSRLSGVALVAERIAN